MSEYLQTDRVKHVLTMLEPLMNQLDPDDYFTAAGADYHIHTVTFDIQKDLHPAVVFAPGSAEHLAKIMSFLYKSSLDFNVRGQGFRSPSSHDVIVSLLKFKDFEYDPVRKLATIGVGLTWVEVAKYMRDADPQFSLVTARTPSVGVGGSILHGGFSWMTSEFGCISDPINLVDAEVVKYDGTTVRAADEPDLLWALRGSGGGFGAMTKVVLRAHYYPSQIWSGMILVPRSALPNIATQIAGFLKKPAHPKTNFLLYSVPRSLLHTILDENDLSYIQGDMIALHVYDACGESHGRSVFNWALKTPGAIDRTKVTDSKGVVDMQQNAVLLRGTMKQFHAVPMSVSHVDEDLILRAMNWQEKLRSIDSGNRNQTMIIFEFSVLKPCISGQAETAFPRSLDDKHYLLVITGCPANGDSEQEREAREIALNAPHEILGKAQQYTILPAGLEEFHDPKKTYGAHWEKLIKLRMRYDPEMKFKGLINPSSQEHTE